MFNVNHFIVSQVNPHVVPFLIKEEDSLTHEAQRSTSNSTPGPSWLDSVTYLAKTEALHRMHTMAEMGIFPNTLTKAVSVLSQKYSGDITIFPEISYADFPRMLSNPTPEFMTQAMLHGERATWPKLSRIKNHCAIELALDEAVQKLRARVVFSPSQVNLRLGAHTRSNSDTRKVAGRGRGRGKATKSKRSMSQTSDPCISTTTKAKDSIIDSLKGLQHNGRQAAKTFPIRSYSSYPAQKSFLLPPELITQPRLLPPKPPHDVVSSEAETSDPVTSDSEVESFSSSTDSPCSPSSPTLPTLWPTTRQLFPFASQPVTPAGYSSTSPKESSSTFPKGKASVSSSAKNLSMTPAMGVSSTVTPSSPEPRYKRLFRNTGGRSKTRSSEPILTPQSTNTRKANALGIEIDISGTRGMVLRRKKVE